MLSNVINKFIEDQIKDNKIPSSDRELYQFGYNLLVFELINISVLILVGLLFQCLIYMVLFAAVYIPLRSYAGGYHAPTPIGCAVLSVMIEAVIAVFLRFSLYDRYMTYIYIAALVAQIIIWFRSPVEAIHKPISNNQRTRFRRRTRTILLFEFAAIVLCMENQISSVGFVIAISQIILSVLILLPQKK